ncbi:MAG: hypothetical protein AAF694_19860 [Bacteroidota bacterium]
MNTQSPWSLFQKFGFRFIFLFWSLYIFPFPINVIPGIDSLLQPYYDLWSFLIRVLGNEVLHIEHDFSQKFTGSGDMLYDWIQNLGMFILALGAALIWSLLDRKRPSYRQVFSLFVMILAYYLAYMMLVYGIIKLFYLQFRPPNMERLFQTFGQASPMRLLWTFMGFSKSYTVFAGASETVAGLLLLFRRTRVLGGWVAFGVMLNVFVLNMSYDVPVKLFSFQLMLMGLFIGMTDFQRLKQFFITNTPVGPATYPPYVKGKIGQRIILGVQVLVVGFILYTQVSRSIDSRKQYGENRSKPPLYGAYEVAQFVRNQDTLAPLLTDTFRWRYLLIDYPNFITVLKVDERMERFTSEIDTVAKTIQLNRRQDTLNKYILNYSQQNQHLVLKGQLEADTLDISLNLIPVDSFALLNRGFRWVNEVPYNRYNYPK